MRQQWHQPTGGPSPQFGYATPLPPPAPPPPLPCPPGPLSYQGSIAAGHTYGGAKGAQKFFSLAHVAPLPAQAVEHPNTILEPNLDSNAIPTLSLLLTPHLTLTLVDDVQPNQNGWHGQTRLLQRLGLGLW